FWFSPRLYLSCFRLVHVACDACQESQRVQTCRMVGGDAVNMDRQNAVPMAAAEADQHHAVRLRLHVMAEAVTAQAGDKRGGVAMAAERPHVLPGSGYGEMEMDVIAKPGHVLQMP